MAISLMWGVLALIGATTCAMGLLALNSQPKAHAGPSLADMIQQKVKSKLIERQAQLLYGIVLIEALINLKKIQQEQEDLKQSINVARVGQMALTYGIINGVQAGIARADGRSNNLSVKQCIIGLQQEKPRSICPDHVIGQSEIPDLGPDVIGVPEPKDFIGRDVIGLQEVPDLGPDVIRIGGDIKPQPIQDNIITGPSEEIEEDADEKPKEEVEDSIEGADEAENILKKGYDPILADKSIAARDAKVAEIQAKSKSQQQKYITVVGGYNIETGEVAVGVKNTATDYKKCAENLVVEQLGGDPSKVIMTPAIRPRNNATIPVCKYCQEKYSTSNFIPGTTFGGD